MIELRHVRVFQTLAEELHFGRTAKRLGIAQPAVSQTLKALEEDVGARLFTRTRREVRLSRAGEAFLVHVRGVPGALERARRAARDAESGSTGRLVIRCAITSALTSLPAAIAELRRAAPEVHVDLAPAPSFEQLALLRTGDIDVGIMPRQGAIAPLAVRLFWRSRLVIAVPARHPFARRTRVALARLAGEDLVFLRAQGEPQTVGHFRARCRQEGFEPRIALEIDSIEMLLGAVASGLGIAVISGDVARLAFPGIRYVPLTPHVGTALCAVWNPANANPVTARFVALIKEAE